MSKILVIDDSNFQRRQLAGFLTSLGYSVQSVENGIKGLESIEEFHPDLIISDLLMPEMSGEELLSKLVEKEVKIPVLILSANIQESVRNRCLELGACGFVNKPFIQEDLKSKLDNLIVL